MKETRKFFENNRLNKGQSRSVNYRQNDNSIMRKQYAHVLPPIDIITEYEDLNPGTLEKLIDMAQKEQNHRHSMDLIEIDKYNKASKLGRMFSLILIAIIAIGTIILSFSNNIIGTITFPTVAFGAIAIAAYFYSKVNAGSVQSVGNTSVRAFRPRDNRKRKTHR
jgi:uncharacterized membrane protein